MSEMILAIAAEADRTVSPVCDGELLPKERLGPQVDQFPEHSFPRGGSQNPRPVTARPAETRMGHPPDDRPGAEESEEEDLQYNRFEEERRRSVYRGRTIWMLRRYMRYAHDTGRLPSILGREFFRTKVTRHTAVTFEDRVIFVHDMETCLHRLDKFSQEVIGRIVLQEYGHEEAAQLLGCTRMTVHRVLVEGLDRLSSILLRVGLIEKLHWRSEKSCQGGNLDDFVVSDCNYGE